MLCTNTKIVATVGPASDSPQCLRELVDAGVDVFRLNFSHGSHGEHALRISAIREAAQAAKRAVAILLDLQGPKIRTGRLVGGEPVELRKGSEFRIFVHEREGTSAGVGTSYRSLPRDLKPGDRILISDGRIELRVLDVSDHEVVSDVVAGGLLKERQGINLPGVAVSAPSLTDKDLRDLEFGLEQEVDWVALSFVRRAADVRALKERIARSGRDTPVIAKIERPEALEELEEILGVVDGLMVARGDLGVELPAERVPLVQKRLLERSNRRARPAITATEMLESMIQNPRPSRAEASDVANAILDGSDAVMLSGETAVGRYPVEAVRTMGRIATELDREHRRQTIASLAPLEIRHVSSHPEAIAAAVASIVRSVPEVSAIWVLTRSGLTARLVSSGRPSVPILGFTPNPDTYRRMALFWGVRPLLLEETRSERDVERHMRERAAAHGWVRRGDTVVITGSHPLQQEAPTNFLKLERF